MKKSARVHGCKEREEAERQKRGKEKKRCDATMGIARRASRCSSSSSSSSSTRARAKRKRRTRRRGSTLTPLCLRKVREQWVQQKENEYVEAE